MQPTRPEVDALHSIDYPVMRAARALLAMEDARELMQALSDVRADAVYEVVKRHGASAASRVFGVNRMNIYRITRGPESRDPEAQARKAQNAQEMAKLLTQMSQNYQKVLEGTRLAETFKNEGELH